MKKPGKDYGDTPSKDLNPEDQPQGADLGQAAAGSEESAAQDQAAAEDATEGSSDEEADDAIIEEAETIVEAAADATAADAEVVAQAKAEVAEWQDKYMRLHAEWDTYRRRTNEQRSEEKLRAAENLITGLLPVLDDFERTIAYANENGEEGLLGGVQAVYAKFMDVLKKDGLEVLSPEGEAFNALEAQAVATVEDTEAFDETVNQVYQKGYRLGSKVLRPAMVTVTTGGPKRPKEEAKEEE